MKITNTIKTMEQINEKKILLIKIGEFYYQYGKDSSIISFIFKYRIKYVENTIPYTCFPKSALNKVLTGIEKLNIDYIIVNKNTNYEEISRESFKKNQYDEIYKSAKEYVRKKNKIDNIYFKLVKNIENKLIDEKIARIEEIINERG